MAYMFTTLNVQMVYLALARGATMRQVHASALLMIASTCVTPPSCKRHSSRTNMTVPKERRNPTPLPHIRALNGIPVHTIVQPGKYYAVFSCVRGELVSKQKEIFLKIVAGYRWCSSTTANMFTSVMRMFTCCGCIHEVPSHECKHERRLQISFHDNGLDEMGGGGREGDFVLWASRLLFSSTEVNFVDNISFPNAS